MVESLYAKPITESVSMIRIPAMYRYAGAGSPGTPLDTPAKIAALMPANARFCVKAIIFQKGTLILYPSGRSYRNTDEDKDCRVRLTPLNSVVKWYDNSNTDTSPIYKFIKDQSVNGSHMGVSYIDIAIDFDERLD